MDGHALVAALGHQFLDPVQLNRVNDRADIRRFLQRIADDQLVHPPPEKLGKAIGHGLGHQDPRAGAADLTLIEPGSSRPRPRPPRQDRHRRRR